MSHEGTASEDVLYQPLAPGHTRVVCVRPGKQGDPFDLQILQVNIYEENKDSNRRYIALSYTWGDASYKVPLKVRGHSGQQHEIQVTRSLVAALGQIRYPDTYAINIWVDQISIDQSSLTERSAQIWLMNDIYMNAQRVFV